MVTPLNHTPMMRIGLKKSAMVSIVAFSTAAALLDGCKRPSEQADVAVDADVQQASYELHNKPDGSTALITLAKAVGNTTASPGEKALANLLAGQAEVQAADAVLDRIDVDQAKLTHVIGQINQLAARVAANDVLVAGLMLKEPKATLAAIDKSTSGAKTGDAGVWMASADGAPVPSLDAVDKNLKELTQQSDGLKAEKADLEKKKADALQNAEAANSKSEASKGKESYERFTEASNFRKDASNLTTLLADNAVKQLAVDREIAIATAKKTQLDAAVTKFADETKQVGEGWQAVQKRIEEMNSRSKGLLEGDAPAPPAAAGSTPVANSITAASDQIDQLSQEIAKLQDDARGHLAKADGYFASAAKENADALVEPKKLLGNPDLRTSPQRLAWQWMLDIHNTSDTDLNKAGVQERLARLSADTVYFASARLDAKSAVQSAIKPANLTLPKSLEGADLDDKIKAAKASADDAFKKAEDLLDAAIAQTGSETLKSLSESATVAKMIEQYGHWAYARSIGDAQADALLSNAKTLASQLTSEPTPPLMPVPLPAEIAPQAAPSSSSSIGAPAPVAPGATAAPSPATATNDTPEQAEVRAAYMTIVNAVSAGDAATAKAMCVPDDVVSTLIDKSSKVMGSLNSLATAAEAKFGAEGKTWADVVSAPVRRVVQHNPTVITVTGDTATLSTGPDDKDPDQMKKVNGKWLLATTPKAASAEVDANFQQMDRLSGVVTQFAADITAGKFVTIKDASQEYLKVIQAATTPGASPAPTTAPGGTGDTSPAKPVTPARPDLAPPTPPPPSNTPPK